MTGVRGRAVELSCGPAVPAVVFWSFTAAGSTGPPQAVAVGSGLEAMVAPGVGALGQASLLNGTLELRELRTAAAGRFFCQGLFPEPGRLRVGYAAVLLRVLGKSPPGPDEPLARVTPTVGWQIIPSASSQTAWCPLLTTPCSGGRVAAREGIMS